MLTEKKNRNGTVYYEDNGDIVAKICAKCNEVKALDSYTKKKAGLGGRESSCKDCKAGYYAENKESYVERHKANKEHSLERMRNYYNANKESYAERGRKWYEENKDYKAECMRKWISEHPEKMAEYSRNWRKDNPERDTLIVERRRARKASLPDDFTSEQMGATFAYFGGCALTGVTSGIHWDHVIPLASGQGGTTSGNMIPLRGDLNISKNDGNIFEWFNRNKDRFKLSQERFDSLIDWLAKVNGMTAEEYRSFVDECFENKRKEAI